MTLFRESTIRGQSLSYGQEFLKYRVWAKSPILRQKSHFSKDVKDTDDEDDDSSPINSILDRIIKPQLSTKGKKEEEDDDEEVNEELHEEEIEGEENDEPEEDLLFDILLEEEI